MPKRMFFGLVVLVSAAFVSLPVLAQANSVYAGSYIQPSGFTQPDLDRELVDFYTQWKDVYLVSGCGEGRAYVDMAGDGKQVWGGTEERSITTSEAHGYGMMISAMMADFDPSAKTTFDALLRFYRDHAASSDPGLMAWNQVSSCENAGDAVGGDNSASDGDLDIAYALVLADARWGSAGEFDYRALGLAALDAIMTHDVSPGCEFVLIGDWVDEVDYGAYRGTTRSSDFLTSHFHAFDVVSGDESWDALRWATYALIENIQARQQPESGLVPDFINGLPDAPEPAPTGFLEGEFDGGYSWNAIRFPWRIALDYLLYDEPSAMAVLTPLNQWIKDTTGGDPERISAGYELDGTPAAGAGTGDLAFVSMFAVSAMIDPAHQPWLDALWEDMLSRDIADDDYYANTLKLMAMITISGHWQTP